MKSSTMLCALAATLMALAPATSSGGAVLLNFGATVSNDTNSPAHQEGDASGTNWNLITADVSSGIVDDGGTSTSLTVNLGRESTTSSQSIDWTYGSYSNSALGAVYDTGVYAGNGRSATYTVTGYAIGARIGGLVAGDYYVYVNGRNTNAPNGENHYFYFTAVSSASGATDYSSCSSFLQATVSNPDSTWTEDVDYTWDLVTIGSDEDLVVVGEGAGGRGFFNTIIIAPANSAPSVDAGSDQLVALADGVSLDATVSDDGEPDPPGAFTVQWTKQSGPGTVTFGSSTSVDTTASFSTSGVYVLRLTADDGAATAYDEVTITVNAPPSVDAGSDDEITLPTDEVSLDGTVSDDGIPASPGSVSVTWTKQSGPGTVTFDDANAVDTDATFSAAGTYVLRLTGDDGDLTAYDEVTITVNPEPSSDAILLNFGATVSNDTNSPAHQESDASGTYWNLITADVSSGIVTEQNDSTNVTVDLGRESTTSSQSIDWSYASYSNSSLGAVYDTGVYAGNGRSATYTVTGYAFGVRISGLAADDYYVYVNGRNTNAPSAENHYFRFTKVSSASGATDFSSLSTVLQATVADPDSTWTEDVDYTWDTVSVTSNEDLVIIAEGPGGRGFINTIAICPVGSGPSNTAPSVDAGNDDSITLPTDEVSLDATVSDDGLPNPPASVSVTWTKQSGPGTVTFDNANAVDTDATFSAAGVYVLRLTADDGDLTAYDEVTITVNSSGDAPVDDAILFNFGATVRNDTNSPLHEDRGATGTYWNLVTADVSSGVVNSVGNSTNVTIDLGRESAADSKIIDWSYASYSNSALGAVYDTGVYAGNGRSATYTVPYYTLGARISGLEAGEYDVYVNARNTNSSGAEDHWFFFGAVSSASGNTDYNTWSTVKEETTTSPDSLWTEGVDHVLGTVEIAANEDIVVVASGPSGRGFLNTVIVCPTSVNRMPKVQTGPNQSILLPIDTVTVEGSVTDDGLPNPPASTSVTWTKQSGPGTVTFDSANALSTEATFSQAGTYVLRLTAYDGALSSYADTIVTVCAALPSRSIEAPAVFNYGSLTLVDEIDCGDPNDSHTLYESTQGVSEIQTILNDQCRVIPNVNDEPSYFAYRIGQNCGLEAGKGYILVVEYPEDLSRTVIVCNYGCETNRGFSTGAAIGDALDPPYVLSNAESMSYRLAGEYRQWQELFHLHDRTQDAIAKDDTRDFGPSDGFYVVIAQLMQEDCPINAGAAARRIALYEAPTEANYTQQLAELPAGLPERHVFWREEMADGVVQGTESEWATIDPIDWYRFKARLSRFLGVNTFTKDLLEFGHCQDWDVAKYDNWYTRSQQPYRWGQILGMLAMEGYDDMSVLPYYEYCGSTATTGGLGRLLRAEPLSGNDVYTAVYWCENLNVDVSDPDVLTDSTKLLEATITDLYAGNRPIPTPPDGGHLGGTTCAGRWAYIDLGSDYDDIRITEGWTRSRSSNGGPASPFEYIYWHDDYTEFAGGTVPQDAVRETTINFVTQVQSGLSCHWTRDFHLSEANAVTPTHRYLVFQHPDDLTDVTELALVGWVEDGGDPVTQTISPVTAGTVPGYWFPFTGGWDDQPEYCNKGLNFLGAWWRMRPTAIPNGFSDTTLERFRQDISYGTTVTRSTIVGQGLLDDYYQWWNLERKGYCEYLRDYLQTNMASDAVFLYTCDNTESGAWHPTNPPSVVTDDLSLWQNLVANPMTLDYTVQNEIHLEALELPLATWGGYEWNHSVPMNDPWNYESEDDIMLTYSFNKLYTVSDPDALGDFQNGSDQMAMMRHYCLNEHCMRTSQDVDIVGYFVCDFEVAGPYCMLPEARALAYGDPTYLGYLAGNNFNRGFPQYVREFNANFLALPAMTMTTETGATTEDDVVVRSISTASDGTWLAIINVGLDDLEDVEITLPVSGTTTDAVTGSAITVTSGKITLDLWPGRLKSVHIDN